MHRITVLVLLWATAAHGESVLETLNRRSSMPPTTVIDWDAGGVIRDYDVRYRAIAVGGGLVEVRGMCFSACTVVVIRIPKERLCFGEFASLNFHQAHNDDGSLATEATKWMIDRYPPIIRAWLTVDMGGMGKMPAPGQGFWTLPAKTLWQMGYRKCDG